MKNLAEMAMVTETTKESGMGYLTAMVDEYGSEMALMTGRLTFGLFFNSSNGVTLSKSLILLTGFSKNVKNVVPQN